MNNWTLTQSTVGDHVFLENSYPGHYTCLNLTTGELYALADFLLPYAQRPILASDLNHDREYFDEASSDPAIFTQSLPLETKHRFTIINDENAITYEPRRDCPEGMQWSDRLGCVSIPED